MKKAPTTKKRKGMKIQGVEPDKKSSYTDKKGKTVELKRYKSKEYKRNRIVTGKHLVSSYLFFF